MAHVLYQLTRIVFSFTLFIDKIMGNIFAASNNNSIQQSGDTMKRK
jgi:hypothetical protein